MAGRKKELPIRVGVDIADPDGTVLGRGQATFQTRPDGALKMVELVITSSADSGITFAHLRGFPMTLAYGIAERAVDIEVTDIDVVELSVEDLDVKISRPDGTDAWYRHFAAIFTAVKGFRSTTNAPATWIAEHNGYPVTAVHRWTREARRRGFLPPDIRSRERKN